MKKKIDARVTFLVSADDHGGSTLQVVDDTSGIRFLEIKIPEKQLAMLLGRMAETKCDAEGVGLEHVGKVQETRKISFELPKDCGYGENRKEAARNIADKMAKEEGPEWKADHYFGGQKSFSHNHKDGTTSAHTSLYRYVDKCACQDCGSKDAEYVIDPWEEDVNNTRIRVWLCDECYQKYCDEI